MRRRSALAAVAATAATVCAPVASADFVIPTPHEPGPNASIAAQAFNDAVDTAGKSDRRCQFRVVREGAATTHDPPPQYMLDAFAVLRRPAAADDALDVQRMIPFAGEVAVDYVRRARVLPDGTSVYLVPSLSARPALAKRPASCSALEREALGHRLRGKPEQAQRAARRLLRDFEHQQRQAANLSPQPGLFVFASGPDGRGGGGGGLDLPAIRKYGVLDASYVRGRGSRLVGLVPDGVATIDFTFARGHGLGLGPERDRVYSTIYRRTAAVVDNVVYLTVPRLPIDALFDRQVWRAPDGTVVNTIKPEFEQPFWTGTFTAG
jgi:hypothetical protein